MKLYCACGQHGVLAYRKLHCVGYALHFATVLYKHAARVGPPRPVLPLAARLHALACESVFSDSSAPRGGQRSYISSSAPSYQILIFEAGFEILLDTWGGVDAYGSLYMTTIDLFF